MSLLNYVDTPNSNLTCCICRTPFTDPVTTRTCVHTFCHECILRALTHSPLCPVDRSPLSAEDLWPASPIVRSLVDELVVECVHKSEGCQHICQRQDLSAHLRDQCMFAEVVCEEQGCAESLLRREMEGHKKGVHVSQSDTKGVDIKGHEAITKAKVDHLQAEKVPTVQSSIACPHASLGCPHTSPSSLISSHLQQCPYESLKHFFPINNTRLALLTEQNVLLRARVGTLESTVGTLRREMNAVKAALGPWMRTEHSQIYTNGSMQIEGRRDENIPASELPVGMQPASASTSSGEPRNLSPTRVPLPVSTSPNSGIDTMGAAPGAYDGQAYAQPRQAYSQSQAQQTVVNQINVDPLAFYFPSEHEERPRGHRASASVSDMGSHINTPFQQHNGVQTPHAYSAASLMHTSALAPAIPSVNTSVHFEATLNGLRDSIVGVAQTVDALRGVVASDARRGEIALANETLRIGEEVMSLRAGVHGLRMQVHTMMMDRSAQMGGTREGGAEGAWPTMTSMNISQPPGSMSGLSTSPMPGRMYFPMAGPPSITKL